MVGYLSYITLTSETGLTPGRIELYAKTYSKIPFQGGKHVKIYQKIFSQATGVSLIDAAFSVRSLLPLGSFFVICIKDRRMTLRLPKEVHFGCSDPIQVVPPPVVQPPVPPNTSVGSSADVSPIPPNTPPDEPVVQPPVPTNTPAQDDSQTADPDILR